MSLPSLSLPSLPSFSLPSFSLPFIGDAPLGPLASLFPSSGPSQPPILTQLPKAQQALQNKYANPDFTGALGSLPPYIANAFTNYDQARVAKGQMPLSNQQTFGALQTAATNVPATPKPSEGLWSRITGDVGALVASIPQLPFNLYNEATQLPQAPEKLSEALGAGSIPGILQGLAEVPGLRMVPGVNTAAILANQGPAGLLEHPVFTALDVLPYAEPAAGALTEATLSKLPSVQAARAATDATEAANFTQSRLDAGLQPPSEQPSALRLALRESPSMQAIGNSPVGMALRNLFGPDARDNAQLQYNIPHKYAQLVNPDLNLAIPPELADVIPPIRNAIAASRQWADAIPEARRTELTNAMQLDRNTVLDDPTLSDAERGFVTQGIYHNDQLANLGIRTGWLGTVDGEVYAADEASRIMRARVAASRYSTLNDARNLMAQATPATAEDTLAGIDPTNIVSEHLTREQQLNLARSYAHTIDGAGYNAQPLLDTVKAAVNDRSIPVDSVRTAFDAEMANLTPVPTMTPTEIYQELQPYKGRVTTPGADPLVAQVQGHINSGQLQDAVEKMRQVNSRSTYVVPNSDQMLDSLIRARDRQNFTDTMAKYNDRAAAQKIKASADLEASTVPARFVPGVEQEVQRRLADQYTTDPGALQLIHDHLYTQLPDLGPNELNSLYRDVAKGWQDMKANGLDPVFVHRVAPSSVPQINRVVLSDVLRTPDSVRERTFDATPYVHDASVAMTGQAMDYLRRAAAEEYVGHLQNLYGKTTAELMDRYTPLARAAQEAQPGLDVQGHLQNLMQSGYKKYDPEGIFGHTQGKVRTIGGTEDMWLPKHVDSTLRQLFHDYNNNRISRLFDPVMKVFRTALIPLSVRSFMHHFIGAGVQVMGESDPLVFLRNAAAARDLVNSGEMALIPGAPPSGLGDTPAYMQEWGKNATKSDWIAAGHSLGAGRWIKENLFDRLSPAIGPAKTAGGNVINKIYDFRQHMDDMYRAVAYIEGKNKALKINPELTDAQAAQAGIGLVRKTMQSWDRMTPMERQTMRMVFPFYGYMSHVLKYAFRYPMDHPWRVGVLDNFARNEVNDFGQALPRQLMDALFLGSPDPKTGNVNTLQLQSLNPFRDVANYFTLAGFTGAANPVIATGLRALGVDPRKGAPSLYPDIAYDPVTGQLRPDNPNLLSSFVGDVIPQSTILTAMLGRNDQFKQVLSSNPDAASAMLRGAAGLPNLFRTVNPAVEAFKPEIQRETLQNQVKNEALRTGDWSKAQQYPGLQPFFSQLSQIMRQNPQVLKAYQSQVQSQSVGNVLPGALTTGNLPGG
jgi:hypothetical protein